MIMTPTDLEENLKIVVGEILDKSHELAEYLENQRKDKPMDEVKMYCAYLKISTHGFREMLEEDQRVPANNADTRSFASKVSTYLTLSRHAVGKLIEAGEADLAVKLLANDLSERRAKAKEYIDEIYSSTSGQPTAGMRGTQNATLKSMQMQPDPLFWLPSDASPDTLALSSKLLLGSLDNSDDQKTLANLTVARLLQDWENGIAGIEELATEAQNDDDQNEISTAVSLLVFTRNQLRTLYNNLAITVQRLEQRTLV